MQLLTDIQIDKSKYAVFVDEFKKEIFITGYTGDISGDYSVHPIDGNTAQYIYDIISNQ